MSALEGNCMLLCHVVMLAQSQVVIRCVWLVFGLHHGHGAGGKHKSGMRVKIMYFGSFGINLGNNLKKEIV